MPSAGCPSTLNGNLIPAIEEPPPDVPDLGEPLLLLLLGAALLPDEGLLLDAGALSRLRAFCARSLFGLIASTRSKACRLRTGSSRAAPRYSHPSSSLGFCLMASVSNRTASGLSPALYAAIPCCTKEEESTATILSSHANFPLPQKTRVTLRALAGMFRIR